MLAYGLPAPSFPEASVNNTAFGSAPFTVWPTVIALPDAVIVPDDVIGPPVKVRPVMPPLTSNEVTVPAHSGLTLLDCVSELPPPGKKKAFPCTVPLVAVVSTALKQVVLSGI